MLNQTELIVDIFYIILFYFIKKMDEFISMSKINQEKIERLNSDADEIIRLSEDFFSSIPIKVESQITSTGRPIPTFDGGYNNTERNNTMRYSWGKLSIELLELQIDLVEKYNLWYDCSSSYIRKFRSDKVGAFDESYKNGLKYIDLKCPPDDKQNIKSFYKFKRHFNNQLNIISLLFSIVECEKNNVEIIQDVPLNLCAVNKKYNTCSIQNALKKIKIYWEKRKYKASNKKDVNYVNLSRELVAKSPILAGIFILFSAAIFFNSGIVALGDISDLFNANELEQTNDYKIAFLSGNFEIDLSKDFSPVTIVEIKVEVNDAEITLLRKSELLEQKIDEYPFNEIIFKLKKIEILSLEPKDAIIDKNKNSSSIIIKFDSSKLYPQGVYSSNFIKGDIVKFGDLKIRLFYRINNDEVFEDIIIPMYLIKE